MLRLHKFLAQAGLASRRHAEGLIKDGRVRVNGSRVTNPARTVAPGDVLTLALPRETRVVRVLGAADRRGSFSVAQGLYEDVAPGRRDG